jgi:hypothetical protein
MWEIMVLQGLFCGEVLREKDMENKEPNNINKIKFFIFNIKKQEKI